MVHTFGFCHLDPIFEDQGGGILRMYPHFQGGQTFRKVINIQGGRRVGIGGQTRRNIHMNRMLNDLLVWNGLKQTIFNCKAGVKLQTEPLLPNAL